MNLADEPRAEGAAQARAPIRFVPRALAWLIVFLRYPLIAAWIAAAVYMTLQLPGISESAAQHVGGLAPEHSEALEAEQTSLSEFQFPLSSRMMLIQRDPGGLSVKSQSRIVRRDLSISQDHRPPFPSIQGALPVPNKIPLLPFGETGTAVLSYLFPASDLTTGESTDIAMRMADQREASGPAPEVNVTGTVPAQVEQGRVISDHLIWLDIATVLLVIVIVGFHFRALLPPIIAVVAVAVAFLVATRLVAWVAARADLDLSNEVTPVMTVLLFGVITDYSIFLMARFRTLLEEGIDSTRAAARRCIGELLPVILAAGLVVALATGSLYLAHLDFLHGLGPGLGLTVLVAMLVGATFVPAMLAIAGHAMLWPRRIETREPLTAPVQGIGGRAVRIAVRHPALVGGLCLAALLAAASGVLEMRTANAQMTNLPTDSSVYRGYTEASEAFIPGMVSPTTIVVQQPGIGGDQHALAELQRGLSQQPNVAAVVGPADNPFKEPLGVVIADDGNAARYLVAFRTDPLGSWAISAARSLRSRMPDLLAAAGLSEAKSLIGGDSALSVDIVDAADSDLARVAPIALAVIFLMLVLLLRALVAPLYLLLASALAVLATLGLTTYLFQDVLGYSGISLFVPLTLAVLLLSLGSDYNIFLVARIWQEARVRPFRDAIEVAGGRSTRAITVAGVVLAASFGAAALIPLVAFRELAFGMAAGLLIDTFIVRSLLVPALISAVGPLSGWPGKRPGIAPSTVPLDERTEGDEAPARESL